MQETQRIHRIRTSESEAGAEQRLVDRAIAELRHLVVGGPYEEQPPATEAAARETPAPPLPLEPPEAQRLLDVLGRMKRRLRRVAHARRRSGSRKRAVTGG